MSINSSAILQGAIRPPPQLSWTSWRSGWQAPDQIFSEVLSAQMFSDSLSNSTQRKGRAVDGQEAGSRQAVSPAAIPTESSSLSARSAGSSPAKDRLVSGPRLQMPALWLPASPYFHFCPAQGGLFSALFDHKRQRFKEVSEEQRKATVLFFLPSPQLFSLVLKIK